MLRTSLRTRSTRLLSSCERFLSSNAQDFIEDVQIDIKGPIRDGEFLSSNAQDFIEDTSARCGD